jgi:hypothetical protein
MYLDDCIVHAVGDDQFIERLEKVLERFRKHLITLKPSKFGMSVIEYCSKQIDQCPRRKFRESLTFLSLRQHIK